MNWKFPSERTHSILSSDKMDKTTMNNSDIDTGIDSPYTEIALKRIINKDYEGRKLLICILLLLTYRFIIALSNLAYIRLELNHIELVVQYKDWISVLRYVHLIVYGVICINIAASIIRLLKPQDKCLDLPLNNKQRKIIGLPLVQGNRGDGSHNYHDDYDEIQDRDNIPIARSLIHENPTVLSPSKRDGNNNTDPMEISRSFANMNLSTNSQRKVTTNNGNTTSPEKIKERLLSSRKRLPQQLVEGGYLRSGSTPLRSSPNTPALNTSFKRPSNKFIYDLSNDDTIVNTTGIDRSFY
ncbi:hypothetical protein FOA43_000738 [Brettanomyces nanus]|uniref:Uncharacterized protein n=1 Tax=Eeniella nana TaxID=13502 RepID=A0A875RXQ1_EENNA|nr:uncharacterized protein FOA43_000738 [Brettanomyces nanus]QPG73428.1 hypothetical protein FOA43_000738 [Brettanomyces nanus]